MRTITSFSLCCILSITSIFAQSAPVVVSSISNGFTVTFTLPTYTLRDTTLASYITNEVFKYVKIDDFGNIYDEGYPMLPQFSLDLRVPSNASNFALATSSQVTQVVSLNRRILPVQEDFGELPATQPTLQLNSSYYASNGSLYGATSQISDPYIVFGENGITMSIFPFIYNPQANTLTVVKQVTFTVTYTGGGGIQQLSVNSSNVKRAYLSDFFTNQVSNMQPLNSSQYEGRYLMITDPYLETTLTPFANYKRTLGYEVTVVNTNVTGKTSTSIRNYLKTQYDNENARPDFVLLVGDHSQIPASAGNVTGASIDDPITDLYYACLDGDDLIADVILGRFPVSSTTFLKYIINKTMYMESNIHNFAKKAKFLAGQEESKWWDLLNVKKNFMESQFKRGHEYAIKNTFNKLGYYSQKLYQPNDVSVRAALNDNPLFFIYTGHGAVTHMAGISFKVDNTFLNNPANTNSVYPFVFSFTCQTGNFANPDYYCIGTNWLAREKGGVSYFGSSVNTMTNSDVAIEEKIFGDAFKDQDRLGAIINLGMRRYSIRFWSKSNATRTERYMKAYNLLGDPSLKTKGYSISGPDAICASSSGSFTVQYLPTNSTVEWTENSGRLTLQGSSNTTVTYKNNSTSTFPDCIITARIKINGVVVATLNKTVVINPVIISSIETSGSSIIVNESTTYTCNHNAMGNNLLNFLWYTQNPSTVNWKNGNEASITFKQAGGSTVYVEVRNLCGTTSKSLSVSVQNSSGGPGGCFKCYEEVPIVWSLPYPNPASGILNIDINLQAYTQVQEEAQAMQQSLTSAKALITKPSFDLRLYDGQGNLLRQATTKGSSVRFNVSTLPNGIYYLHIYDGVSDKPVMQQIIIEH